MTFGCHLAKLCCWLLGFQTILQQELEFDDGMFAVMGLDM